MSTVVNTKEPVMEDNAMAPAQGAPLDLPTEVFSAGLARRAANRSALMDWIRQALVDGVDYGRIHTTSKNKCRLANEGRSAECQEPSHWSKPVLFKPGTEKICGMLGLTAHYPSLAQYETAAYSGVDVRHVILRCEIRDSVGRVVAEGCGARSVEKDYGDLNKSIKMAEKSGLCDAILRCAGLSELFTQDLDQVREDEETRKREKPTTNALADPITRGRAGLISAPQARHLEARITSLGLSRERVKDWIAKRFKAEAPEHLRDLSHTQYKIVDAKLDEWAKDNPPPQKPEPILERGGRMNETLPPVNEEVVGQAPRGLPEAEALRQQARAIREQAEHADSKLFHVEQERAQELERQAAVLEAQAS